MNENTYGVKKVDVFNDIVSRLEDSKKARVSDDVVSGMKNYYNNKQEYRNRVSLLADNLKGIKPIDSEVNNVIYLSNYTEKGIAIKTSIISFKQIWVEYRLIFNENTYKEENNIPMHNEINMNQPQEPATFSIPTEQDNNQEFKLPTFENHNTYEFPNLEEKNNEYNMNIPDYNTNNFGFNELNSNIESFNTDLDENYNKLYNKIIGISTYVESFNRKKTELDRQIAALEERKNQLSNELRELENAKLEFSRYRDNEEKKIKEMKNEVNNKVISLQNLIDNLDNILGKIN